jgi:hypothetical protein
MKTYILSLLMVGFIAGVSAQNNPEQLTADGYMKLVPAFPEKICLCDPSVRDAFTSSVSQLRQNILDDANQREQQISDFMHSKQEDLKANMVKNSGMSEADIQKLKNGKGMTQAEKMEMANRMMQQKTNISMEEAQNLKKMSKAGKEAWAQGYATEQQAMTQTGVQQKNPMAEMSLTMTALMNEQTALVSKLQAMELDLKQKIEQINGKAQSDKILMEKELEPFYQIINSHNGEGATQKDIDNDRKAREQVRLRQVKYCEKFTPEVLAFLKDCKTTIESAYGDYDHLEEIQYQIVESQSGKKMSYTLTHINSIRAVATYLGYVEGIFKYRLY